MSNIEDLQQELERVSRDKNIKSQGTEDWMRVLDDFIEIDNRGNGNGINSNEHGGASDNGVEGNHEDHDRIVENVHNQLRSRKHSLSIGEDPVRLFSSDNGENHDSVSDDNSVSVNQLGNSRSVIMNVDHDNCCGSHSYGHDIGGCDTSILNHGATVPSSEMPRTLNASAIKSDETSHKLSDGVTKTHEQDKSKSLHNSINDIKVDDEENSNINNEKNGNNDVEEDEEAKAERLRSERKRCREKQRRTDVNIQFEALTSLLRRVEAQDLESDDEDDEDDDEDEASFSIRYSNPSQHPNPHSQSQMPGTVKDEIQNPEGLSSVTPSTSKHKKRKRGAELLGFGPGSSIPSNRVDLIARTIAVLDRLHELSGRRRKECKELKKACQKAKRVAAAASSHNVLTSGCGNAAMNNGMIPYGTAPHSAYPTDNSINGQGTFLTSEHPSDKMHSAMKNHNVDASSMNISSHQNHGIANNNNTPMMFMPAMGQGMPMPMNGMMMGSPGFNMCGSTDDRNKPMMMMFPMMVPANSMAMSGNPMFSQNPSGMNAFPMPMMSQSCFSMMQQQSSQSSSLPEKNKESSVLNPSHQDASSASGNKDKIIEESQHNLGTCSNGNRNVTMTGPGTTGEGICVGHLDSSTHVNHNNVQTHGVPGMYGQVPATSFNNGQSNNNFPPLEQTHMSMSGTQGPHIRQPMTNTNPNALGNGHMHQYGHATNNPNALTHQDPGSRVANRDVTSTTHVHPWIDSSNPAHTPHTVVHMSTHPMAHTSRSSNNSNHSNGHGSQLNVNNAHFSGSSSRNGAGGAGNGGTGRCGSSYGGNLAHCA